MAIYRVIIRTEKANFEKVFTDHEQAIKETDDFLFANELNDGCSLGSEEDFLALNALLAEMFDDCYNCDNFAQWDDIEQGIMDRLAATICHQEAMQPGTVSRATLRNDDIALACIEAIFSVDPDKVKEILENDLEAAQALFEKATWNAEHKYWETEDAFLFVSETLFDIMESLAPAGYYFGNNEGDASDFGYWPYEDHLEGYE